MDSLNDIKEKLNSYKKIYFNEPHFTERLELREGNKNEVEKNLKYPKNLIHYDEQKGKYGDTKYTLYFKISNNRTMILPVIFKPKYLYVITYILRHRALRK